MSAKRRLAALVQRLPGLFRALRNLYRATRPGYSAGAIAAVVDPGGRVLVVKHVFHIAFPWGLPGGWLDRGESPDEAVVRELREETGLEVDVVRLVLLGHAPGSRHFDFGFLCRPLGEVVQLSGELLEHAWAAPDALPPMPPVHAAVVRAALSGAEAPVIVRLRDPA